MRGIALSFGEPSAAPTRITTSDLVTAAVFTAGSLALYLALGQGVLYGDGAEFMLLLHDHAAGHKNHLTYLPLLRAAAVVGAPFGCSAFASARACSQVGAALGVGLCHLAARRFGLGRSGAAWLTALIATTPSLVFFATVVEVHAPYFACLGLAWFATANLVRRPTAAAGAGLGLACGLAYLAHASGLVLPGPLLLVAAAATVPRGRLLRPAAACLLAHVAVVILVPWALSYAGHHASPLGAARFLMWWKVELLEKPITILLVLWDEWLLAYLPISVLWLRSFWRMHAAAVVALAALVPYLGLSLALLSGYREFGAYQHAVLFLFAWLTLRTWGAGVRGAALVVALAVGIAKVVANDDRARVAAYDRGLCAVAGPAPPLLLVGDFADFEQVFVARPGLAFENLAAPGYAEATAAPDAHARLDARVAGHRAAGGRVFLTRGAVGFVTTMAARAPEGGFAALLDHLTHRYRRQLVAADGFAAYELVSID